MAAKFFRGGFLLERSILRFICVILQIMFSKRVKKYLPLVTVVILASILRLWMLNSVPVSMSDDEIRFVYTSYSLAQTGKDAFGNFLPLVFKMDGANTYGQVPMYLSSIPFFFLDLNPFTARLPYALSGILSVVLFYFILKKILNNEAVALLSAFVLSVSVWHIQISRLALEADITLLIYLSAITVFIYAKKRTKFIVLSMMLFFFAFHGYAALKVIFLPLLLTLVLYKFKELSKKHLLIILATIVLSFGSFAYLSKTQGASSYSSKEGAPFFFQDKEQTALAVELERRFSDEPPMIEKIYHNKFTYWFRIFSSNYLHAFSPDYLFLSQEANGIYSIWGRGELYMFELPFIFMGALWLFMRKRREFYSLLFLLLISPLPSALGTTSPTWTSRSSFMIFWLCAFIGAGIFAFVTYRKEKVYKYLAILFISALYLYGVLGYLSQYYYDWSRTNAKYFSKSTKDLVYMIDRYKKEGKTVMVSGATVNTFMHYAFYNKTNPSYVHLNINKHPIEFENMILSQDCFFKPFSNPYALIPANHVYITELKCSYKVSPTSSIKTFDNQETIWNIYESRKD
ncbi:MAG: glycosyl transferase family 39 [uncultured bacterium]|nr:MAG: glycosyl transferase family 39 [uncultured bacterium]